MKNLDKKETRGRKPVSDKKIPIHILPRQSEVDILGGRDIVRRMCEDYITSQSFIKKYETEIIQKGGA